MLLECFLVAYRYGFTMFSSDNELCPGQPYVSMTFCYDHSKLYLLCVRAKSISETLDPKLRLLNTSDQ